MRILIRTSKWAIWARRTGSLALPVAILPVFMHRERMITTPTFHLVEVVAIGIATLALLLALGAFVRLWVSGDQGWGKATIGLMFSLAVLLPVGLGAFLASRYPPVTDISTDTLDPPVLTSGLATLPSTPDIVAQVRLAYPNAQGRAYAIDVAQVYAIASALVAARGWDLRLKRAPQTPLDEARINAVVTTLLGWRDEVSIRIRGVAGGARVDMRSAALSGIPDIGANGLRIEEFLLALDNEITVLMRDTPAESAPVEEPSG